MRLALFDFDGTVARKDSFLDFLEFAVGRYRLFFGLACLSPILIAYAMRIKSNSQAKTRVLSYFLGGWSVADFEKIAADYSRLKLQSIIKPSALQRIQWHQRLGHKVTIVTASFEDYLRGWCTAHHLDVMGSRVEVNDGKLTGRIAGENCHGEEKVRRIKEHYPLKDFEYIYAYGDQPSDKVLKTIAHEFHYRSFGKD